MLTKASVVTDFLSNWTRAKFDTSDCLTATPTLCENGLLDLFSYKSLNSF